MSKTVQFIRALAVVLLAILLLGFHPDTPITGDVLILGTGGYDIKMLQAPVVKAWVLQFFASLLTKTRFGPTLRRVLLNGNGISMIRELASQVALPPLHFPVRRVSKEQLYEVPHEVAAEQFQHVLSNGFGTELDNANGQLLRSVSEYAQHYREGNMPSTVMKHLLHTIREWERDGFNVFATVYETEVMTQAAASDVRHAEGKPLSIFDGVPIAFKDMMAIKNHMIYDGAHPKSQDKWALSREDDVMVKRFRDLGAIILGTTLMTEGGTSPLGYSSHFNGPLNPYSAGHYCGGSSSGSAVAVATGLVPVAIGFDGGGSIRLPAAMSGVHGLATGFARVPFDGKISSTMIKSGPLAASALDAALAFAVMAPNEAGNYYTDSYDGGVYGPPAAHLNGFTDIHSLEGVRLGVFSDWFNDAEPAVRERAWQAVEFMKERGATVVEISIPHMQWLSMSHGIKISSEFALGWDKRHHNRDFDTMEPNTRITVGIGSSVTALEVLAAEKLRAWAFEYVADIFRDNNLSAIVSPTIGILPPVLDAETKIAGESNTGLTVTVMKHIFLANLLGLPGYSVPIGFLPSEHSGAMLPVGLHLLGDHWQEHKLLRLANAVEIGFSTKLDTLASSGTLSRVYDPFHRTPASTQQM